MRLYELAYCCRIVGALGAFDRATIEMRDATGDFVDPANADHHAPLFSWLRRWGCRQFAKDDELTSSESLTRVPQLVGTWMGVERP